jgi:hypothetical protein
MKLRVEDVQGRNCLTNFYGMDLTSDKVRSLVRKWQTTIEVREIYMYKCRVCYVMKEKRCLEGGEGTPPVRSQSCSFARLFACSLFLLLTRAISLIYETKQAHVDVKTTDGYVLRLFVIAFTKKRPNQIKRTAYAQSSQIKLIRKKMMDIVNKEASSVSVGRHLVGQHRLSFLWPCREGCSSVPAAGAQGPLASPSPSHPLTLSYPLLTLFHKRYQ